MKIVLRFNILFIMLISSISCSQNNTTVDDFNFMLGNWKSEIGRKLYSKCECHKVEKEEIKCQIVTYKRSDSSEYSIVKYHLKKESNNWVIDEEIFGTRQQYKVFDLDKSKKRTFQVKKIDSSQIFSIRKPENDGEQNLVIALSKDKKLIMTDYFYTFNFEKIE